MKAISSGLQGASAVVFAAPCWYLGATLVTDDAAEITMTIWDSPNSTLTNDTEVDWFKGNDEKLNVAHILTNPVWCSKGIYAKLSADTGDYIVWYAL